MFLPPHIKDLLLSYVPPWWAEITYEELYAQCGDWNDDCYDEYLESQICGARHLLYDLNFEAHISAKYGFEFDEPFRRMMLQHESPEYELFPDLFPFRT